MRKFLFIFYIYRGAKWHHININDWEKINETFILAWDVKVDFIIQCSGKLMHGTFILIGVAEGVLSQRSGCQWRPALLITLSLSFIADSSRRNTGWQTHPLALQLSDTLPILIQLEEVSEKRHFFLLNTTNADRHHHHHHLLHRHRHHPANGTAASQSTLL